MTIAILAHDSKKELMADFCNAYSGILSRHKIIATASTANVVEKGTGLEIRKLLSGAMGGTQQLCSFIACGEVDMVIVFNDYNVHARGEDVHNVLRLCDMYMVPVATNIASAEMLIHGLARGDLDWRQIKMDTDSSIEAV